MGALIKYSRIKDNKFETEITINYYSCSNRLGNSEYYEHDKDCNRYYLYVPSENRRSDMDGALVKRRISKSFFEETLELAKKYTELAPKIYSNLA